MRKTFTLHFLAIVLALLATGTAWAAQEEEEVFEQSVAVGRGGLVSVENVNGSIEVNTWNGSEVKIWAKKKARAGRAAAAQLLHQIEINVVERGNGVAITTELPRPVPNQSASVQYVLTVPEEVDLDLTSTNGKIDVEGVRGRADLRTTNGSIKVRGLGGDLDAHTTNGKIDVEDIAGTVQAKTTNGSIRADISAGSLGEDMSLVTTNGSVELALEGGVAARIDASTSNGSVRYDLPLDVLREKKDLLEGELGGGGPLIKIRTSNGSVRILER